MKASVILLFCLVVLFSFSVNAQANTGSTPRTGTITAGGQTFTVNQFDSCSYSIAPMNATVPASGANVNIAVTAPDGCAWSVSNSNPWIAVFTGSSQTGNGTILLAVQPNTGAPRQGTVIVAGQTFTVFQNGGAPSTEFINVAGRVMSADNKPVRRAIVTLINTATNETYNAMTNHFGYFHTRVQRSQPHILKITHKRYKFTDRTVAYNTGALIPIYIYIANPE